VRKGPIFLGPFLFVVDSSAIAEVTGLDRKENADSATAGLRPSGRFASFRCQGKQDDARRVFS
jgi:hypothetical protein